MGRGVVISDSESVDDDVDNVFLDKNQNDDEDEDDDDSEEDVFEDEENEEEYSDNDDDDFGFKATAAAASTTGAAKSSFKKPTQAAELLTRQDSLFNLGASTSSQMPQTSVSFNRFVSVAPILPMYREQSFQYLMDDNNNNISTNNNNNVESSNADLMYNNNHSDDAMLFESSGVSEVQLPVVTLDNLLGVSESNHKLRTSLLQKSREIRKIAAESSAKQSQSKSLINLMKQRMRKLISRNTELQSANVDIESKYARTLVNLAQQSQSLTVLQSDNFQTQSKLAEFQLRNESLQAQIQVEQAQNNLLQTQLQVYKPYAGQSIEVPLQQHVMEQQELSVAPASIHQDWTVVHTTARKQIQDLQTEVATQSALIDKLQIEEMSRKETELQLRLARDESEIFVSNNQTLSRLLAEKTAEAQTIQEQANEYKVLALEHPKLLEQIAAIQEDLNVKHRLLIEQEVLHQVRMDQLKKMHTQQQQLRVQQKTPLGKQLNQLLDLEKVTGAMESLEDDDDIDSIENEKQEKEDDLLKSILGWKSKRSGNTLDLFIADDEDSEEMDLKKKKEQNDVRLQFAYDDKLKQYAIVDEEQLLENARDLITMIAENDSHFTTLAACVEPFWLISAFALKRYLKDNEDQADAADSIAVAQTVHASIVAVDPKFDTENVMQEEIVQENKSQTSDNKSGDEEGSDDSSLIEEVSASVAEEVQDVDSDEEQDEEEQDEEQDEDEDGDENNEEEEEDESMNEESQESEENVDDEDDDVIEIE